MTGIGAIIPADALEDYLRRVANLPDRMEGTEPRAPRVQDMEGEIEDGADEKAAFQARKRSWNAPATEVL